ncbi:MAG: HAMP domain-containing histidine kinase [Ardenticatenaceae bacterium]|nr:HAMP domain-containing histidine kinase [Ardenticatenaceae bacterium]HBY94646.1 two-component sensor histidine kinase [Chloroflexota bacterium]
MTTPRRWWPSTIRVRLTLLYAGAFFLAGVTLVALMYLYLGQTLNHQLTVRGDITEQTLQHQSPEVHDALRAQLQQARDDTLNTMLIASLIMLGVVGVIAGGFGWLLAGQALHPLRQITATARRIADRSLHERIALVGPNDEIKELADTLDAMLERLDRSFDSQRRFVANASHELRTPLTINRTLIEVALSDPQANESLRQLGATLLAVNQRHERLIDGLLTLASSEQHVTESTLVDLADIARHITTESQGAAQNAGVAIRTHLLPAPVAGDPVLLERLTQNLVDNAIRYNLPEHGWVTVTTGVVDDNVHLTVENTGPPVPPYEVPSLFEPFRRLRTTERLADSANTSISRGAGLGLSIVQSVAHALGGDVYASPREDGGLAVRVRIPAVSEKSKPHDWNKHSLVRGGG